MEHPNGRILIVDANANTLGPLTSKLKQCGFSVVCVENGLDAIHTFITGRFDLVLTDLSIPGLNGNLLARYFHNLSEEAFVVAVTATPWLANEAFDLVIEKPFESKFMADAITYCGTHDVSRLEPVERPGYQANARTFTLHRISRSS